MRKLLLMAVVVTGCSSDTPQDAVDLRPARQLPAAVKDDAAAIARANNQLAFDLYGELAATPGNTLFSPFSVATAMAMIDAGAAGTTDQELREALHLGLPGERTHTAFGALLASLQTGRTSGLYTLATANRLFGQQGFAFLPSFLTITQRDYGAELLPVDFERDTEGARRTINGWVSEQTEAKIPELFEAGQIESSTRLVLANAIVFKGSWAIKFDRARTAKAAFQLASGAAVQADMMHKREAIAIKAIPGGVLGLLPFTGQDLSMGIVLPDQPGGLPAIEAQLGGDVLAQWIAGASVTTEEVDVVLPRFGVTSAFPLKDALAALGVTSAFDPATADFSALDGARDLYLQRVVHKAVITVDEDGAEAAAATGGGAGTTSAPQPFVVDRPFVFFIYDHVTGSVLFLGRVADPTK